LNVVGWEGFRVKRQMAGDDALAQSDNLGTKPIVIKLSLKDS